VLREIVRVFARIPLELHWHPINVRSQLQYSPGRGEEVTSSNSTSACVMEGALCRAPRHFLQAVPMD